MSNNNVLTAKADLILNGIGEISGVTIDLVQLVDTRVLPEWGRVKQHQPMGSTKSDLERLFHEILKGGLEILLYSGTTLYLMPDERDYLLSVELWIWFLGVNGLTINVVGEGEQTP